MTSIENNLALYVLIKTCYNSSTKDFFKAINVAQYNAILAMMDANGGSSLDERWEVLASTIGVFDKRHQDLSRRLIDRSVDIVNIANVIKELEVGIR